MLDSQLGQQTLRFYRPHPGGEAARAMRQHGCDVRRAAMAMTHGCGHGRERGLRDAQSEDAEHCLLHEFLAMVIFILPM